MLRADYRMPFAKRSDISSTISNAFLASNNSTSVAHHAIRLRLTITTYVSTYTIKPTEHTRWPMSTITLLYLLCAIGPNSSRLQRATRNNFVTFEGSIVIPAVISISQNNWLSLILLDLVKPHFRSYATLPQSNTWPRTARRLLYILGSADELKR